MSDTNLPSFDIFEDSLHLRILSTKPFITSPSSLPPVLSILTDIEHSISQHVFGLDARTQAAESQQNLQLLAKISTRWLVQLLDSMTETEQGDVERVASLLAVLSGRGSSGPVTRKFGFEKAKLEIREPSYVEAEIGWQTWGSAVLAAKLVDAEIWKFQGRGVLELGCGTGLAGLMAYLGGGASKLVLTDYQEAVLRNVVANIEANIPVEEREKVVAQKLDWRDQIGLSEPPEQIFDTILAADCIFELEHGDLVPLVVDRFLRTFARTLDEDTVLVPEFVVVLPLREKYKAEIANFEKNMDKLVAKGRLVEMIKEELELEEDLNGLRYRRYRWVRPDGLV